MTPSTTSTVATPGTTSSGQVPAITGIDIAEWSIETQVTRQPVYEPGETGRELDGRDDLCRRLGDRYLDRHWASCSPQQAVQIAPCARRPIGLREPRATFRASRRTDTYASLNGWSIGTGRT
jgi:hypothetical protein